MENKEVVKIKLLENPDNPLLKMKFIGAKEYISIRTGEDGKPITGLDSDALTVNSIDDTDERKRLKTQLDKERKELERLLNVDLSPYSDFWNKLIIVLGDEDVILDPSNPLDKVKERFLVANCVVSPSREAIDTDERYMKCIYYLYREKEEVTKKAKKQQRGDKAIGKLSILTDENPNKLKLIAAYLFNLSPDDLTADSAYTKIRDGFSTTEELKNKAAIDAFLEVVEKSSEEITIKILLDKAIRKHIITKKGKVFYKDDLVLGNSYEEALEYLTSVENTVDVASLKKELKNL